jgi:pimeloyl-ACP methyl ester carboxylesterase
LGWCVRYFPSLFFTIMKRSVTAPDREALAQPGMQAHFTTVLQEAFRQGGRGPAWEALICYRPWGFDLADIPLPVHVWAGDQDIFVSNEMVEAMAQRLRHPIIHRLPGKGHLCIEHWEDALQV